MNQLPRIAVFAGPTATICNTPDLVTSNQARARHKLPALLTPDGREQRFDLLRPQRLAAPVTVYVEAFTAHPLERDAAVLSAQPDGWLDGHGALHSEPPTGPSKPVYVVELRPEDGLYQLPYMGRQADGSAWEQTSAFPFAPMSHSRQSFFPDASRLYEEIDRFCLTDFGRRVPLSAIADFEFFRAGPSGGYTGLADGTDPAQGSRGSERLGEDFFGYYPHHLGREPHLATLAQITNQVQQVLDSGSFDGLQWLEGSPNIEETMYWLNLLVDTQLPMVGHSAQRRQQSASADGPRNIVDGVRYLASRVALDEAGRDRVGAVVIVDELVYSAREVTKVDARPGGYQAIGGHGGVVADVGGYEAPQLTFVPARKHTYRSEVRLSQLPSTVPGVEGSLGQVRHREVAVRDEHGLIGEAIPMVSVHKYLRYTQSVTGEGPAEAASEVEILARVSANLADAALSGFVVEGMSPFGSATPTMDAALAIAVFSGMPVVRVGRGNTAGRAYPHSPIFAIGNNLSSTKARMLLMAAILRHGMLPPAVDPGNPTAAELSATVTAVARLQELFDTH